MKKKKGFTLIELLVVIVIIGVIALIVTPIITGVIGKSEKKTFEESIHGIFATIRIDTANDKFQVPREYFYDHGTLTLVSVKNVPKETVVKTDGRYDGTGRFLVDSDGNIIIIDACNDKWCATNDKDKPDIVIKPNENGKPLDDPLDPTIKLVGDKSITVELNGTYVDPGVISATVGGEELPYSTSIRKGTSIVDSIDTSVESTYSITYSNESNGKTASVTRTVAVVDMTPQITIDEPNGNYVKSQRVSISVSAIRPNTISSFSYNITKNGASYSGESVTGTNKVITLNETGTYEVTVNVSDDNGHSNSVTKIYKVDSVGPVITLDPEIVELTTSQVQGYDLFTGVTVTDDIDGSIDVNSGRVKISGDLSAREGTYYIKYSASDSTGNTTEKNRVFNVTNGNSSGTPEDIITNDPDVKTDDPDENPRYTGSNPNNYVRFNNELYRIIGLFNGQMKLIKNDFYSTSMYWDQTDNNDWNRPATLNPELNNTYWNTISEEYQFMIDQNYSWKIGGTDSTTRVDFYNAEKNKSWTGKVGLMSVADYGYACASCTDETLMSGLDLKENNWIYNSSREQWTITPDTTYPNAVWTISTISGIYYLGADRTNGVRPVVYLKSSILIDGGEGTASNPYILKNDSGPSLTFDKYSTDGKWTKAQNITITATDPSGLSTFTYEIFKDGVSQGPQSVSTGSSNIATYSIALDSDGTYTITLSSVNKNGTSSTLSSGTYMIDVTPPSFSLPSDNTVKSTLISTYNLRSGVSVSDNSGESLDFTVSGELSSTLGNHTITYTATDSAGNTASVNRVITVVEAEGPTLNFSSASSGNTWLGKSKNRTITLYATDNNNLASFTYQVIKDNVAGVVQNVSVSGNSAQATTTFNESGIYKIKLTGSDEYGNTSEIESGEYKVDVEDPIAGTATITGTKGTGDWYTSNVTITPVNGSDTGGSGHASTTVSVSSITASTNGTTVTVTTRDNAGNSSTRSYTVKVDKDKPIVGTIGGNSTSWTTSKTLTSTITDTNSKVRYYAVTTSSSTPTNWTSVGNIAVASYSLSHTVTANGTYYIWAKDEAGNVSAAKSVEVTKIDTTTPSITSSYTSTAYSVNEKTSVAVSTLYSATFGGMGGSVTCKNGSTTVTNLNTLAVGSYTLTCTATGLNGKTASVSPKVTIKSAGKTPTEIVTGPGTTTTGGGTRYTGANPNNYVTFNGENYRIIGVFNGQLKIMKDSNYGNQAWDTSNSNSWTRPATLNTTLNSTYWNTISSTYKAMVDQSHSWGIGGRAYSESSNSRSEFYSVENNTRWTGKVGLMSVADFGYASSNSGCTDSTNLYTTNNACMSDNWMFTTSFHQWTIAPRSGYSNLVWLVSTNGLVDWYSAGYTTRGVRPVVYLKSSIKITGGTGTSSDPYKLSS